MHRISESLRTSQPHQWMLASLIAAGAILRLIAMLPGGYALDEEITQFAVDGIREHWLPLFPSGALNDRAVSYSYAAWIAGSLFGDGLPSYRLISLVSGVMAVLLTYAAARWVATASAALAATLLLVLFLPHVEASVWARSYSLTTTAYLGALVVFLRGDRGNFSTGAFLALCAMSAFSHELAVTLLLLPLLRAAIDREPLRAFGPLFGACAAVFASAKLSLIALHFLAPNAAANTWAGGVGSPDQATFMAAPLGAFMAAPLGPVLLASWWLLAGLAGGLSLTYVALRRYTNAPHVVLALCLMAAGSFQLGLLALVLVCAILIAPDRVRAYSICALASASFAAVFWTLHTTLAVNSSASVSLMRSLSMPSLVYPWRTVIYVAQALPITGVMLGLVAVVAVLGTCRESRIVRLLLLLVTANMVLLSVLNVPLRSRYFVVFWPVIVILIARGIEFVRGSGEAAVWRPIGTILAWVLVAALATEQCRYGRNNPVVPGTTAASALSVPRVDTSGWAELLSSIPRDAVIITNDELASAYHLRRVDYWLTTSTSDLNQYAVHTGAETRGLYGNGRIISSGRGLVQLANTLRRPWAFVLFKTGRFGYTENRKLALESLRQPGVSIREAPSLFLMLMR